MHGELLLLGLWLLGIKLSRCSASRTVACNVMVRRLQKRQFKEAASGAAANFGDTRTIPYYTLFHLT